MTGWLFFQEEDVDKYGLGRITWSHHQVLMGKVSSKEEYVWYIEKNHDALPGKPDIALTKYKIAIFCDGEFFHGKDWEVIKPRLENSNNGDYWISKISRNINRDEEVNKELLFMGWTVIRFWGKEIKRNTDECVRVIEEVIFENEIENRE